ncbi:MAG: MFS transporter [Candidatus Cloacimonetes bacterium]|nr:MFS transporter [Candidatus Cloacimonadota bacterium]
MKKNITLNYEKNVKLYSPFRVFTNLLIIGPILVPFMIFKGLSYSQIMLLQSISAISVFIFEIPTGTIGDKVSRKISLMLSGIFCIFGLLIYIMFSSFYLFAFAEIIFGIGMTFSSGADSAILYESLVKLKRKKEYQKVEGNAAFYLFIGQAIGSLISGFLYKHNPFFPFYISIINLIIAVIVASLFKETERKKSEHKYIIHVFKSINITFKTPRILWTVLFAALMGFAFRTSFWLYQPYFSLVNIDVQWFGVIFFFFNIVAALSSKILLKKFYDTRPRKVLISLTFLLAATFLLPIIFVFPAAIVILALQQIVRGLYRPTLNFYINHQIKDEYRATVISLVSLSASLSFAILSPFVGINLDKHGTVNTYFWMGVISLGGIIMLVLLRKYQKLRKINKVEIKKMGDSI